MSALVIDAVVRQGDIHVVDGFYATKRQKFARKLGDGTALKIRIEPEEEATRWAQFKHLFGHVLRPVSDVTGYTEAELCLMAKERFLPDDGRTSLTQLNYDELDALTKQTEQWLREEFPDAFLLHD